MWKLAAALAALTLALAVAVVASSRQGAPDARATAEAPRLVTVPVPVGERPAQEVDGRQAGDEAALEVPPALALGDAGAPAPMLSALAVDDAGGTPPGSPNLPGDAPKAVTFGVVLVQYRGAQGAPSSAPSRDEARRRASELAELARTDFKAAVAKGDKGSMEDAGRMPRGVLEPQVEFALFSLEKGGVSDPIETPRGFWIAQRID